MVQHHQPGWNDEGGPRARARGGGRAAAGPARRRSHLGRGGLPRHPFPGIRAAQWVAAFAPAGLPADIIAALHKAFVAAMGVPEMQEAFARGGMLVPRPSALADPKAWLREEMASWKRDVEDTGIVVEE